MGYAQPMPTSSDSIKRSFEDALREYGAEEDQAAREQQEARLWESYGQRCAVFISDLSGFSRLTEQYSIVHFLALIQRCRALLVPVIEAAGGALIKTTADNVYATFPTAEAAIEASIEGQRVLARDNAGRHPDWQIGLCVGVGYGEILVLSNQDFFGHQLNLAFKLGEDVASSGEVLVTSEALEAAGAGRYPHEARTVLCSGITIAHASVHYEL